MILADVNILVYAHREDMPDHCRYQEWLEGTINGPTAYGVSELVLSSFITVVTNKKVFARPSTLRVATRFCEQIKNQQNCVLVTPGPRHWEIFADLCQRTNAVGNLVPDAYLAALAIESGCEWITADQDYALFPGLKFRHPLE